MNKFNLSEKMMGEMTNMRIPFLSRLMEIKETQLRYEKERLLFHGDTNSLLREILKELKGGKKDGKYKNRKY